jgi:hypothetical protein
MGFRPFPNLGLVANVLERHALALIQEKDAVNAGKKPVRKKGRNKTGTRLRKVRVHGHGTMGAGAS